jgi:septal ring factor EnvC (AmiA/AmiB activator)
MVARSTKPKTEKQIAAIDTEIAQLKLDLKAMKSENLRLQKLIATMKAKHVTEINEVKAAVTPSPRFVLTDFGNSFTEVAKKIVASDDSDAKGVLRQLLENSTAVNIVGLNAVTLLTSLDA